MQINECSRNTAAGKINLRSETNGPGMAPIVYPRPRTEAGNAANVRRKNKAARFPVNCGETGERPARRRIFPAVSQIFC